MAGIAFKIKGVSFINSPLGRVDKADSDVNEQITNAYLARIGGDDTYHNAVYNLVSKLRTLGAWDNIYGIYPMLGGDLDKMAVNLKEAENLVWRSTIQLDGDLNGVIGSYDSGATAYPTVPTDIQLDFVDGSLLFAFAYSSCTNDGDRGFSTIHTLTGSKRAISLYKGNVYIKDWTVRTNLTDRGLAPSMLTLDMNTKDFNAEWYANGQKYNESTYSSSGGQTAIMVDNGLGGISSGSATGSLYMQSDANVKMYAFGTIDPVLVPDVNLAFERFLREAKGYIG